MPRTLLDRPRGPMHLAAHMAVALSKGQLRALGRLVAWVQAQQLGPEVPAATEVGGRVCIRTARRFSAGHSRFDGSCSEVSPPSAYDFGDTHFGDVTNISL